jgi:hypothetical protein
MISSDLDDPEFWKNVTRNEPLSAIQKCEEAGKQLITLTTLLSAIYFGILSFSDPLKQLVTSQWLWRLILVIPLPLWLLSLWCASRVIVPEEADIEEGRWFESYDKIKLKKYKWLKWSHGLLMASIVLLVIAAAFVFLQILPNP